MSATALAIVILFCLFMVMVQAAIAEPGGNKMECRICKSSDCLPVSLRNDITIEDYEKLLPRTGNQNDAYCSHCAHVVFPLLNEAYSAGENNNYEPLDLKAIYDEYGQEEDL